MAFETKKREKVISYHIDCTTHYTVYHIIMCNIYTSYVSLTLYHTRNYGCFYIKNILKNIKEKFYVFYIKIRKNYTQYSVFIFMIHLWVLFLFTSDNSYWYLYLHYLLWCLFHYYHYFHYH